MFLLKHAASMRRFSGWLTAGPANTKQNTKLMFEYAELQARFYVTAGGNSPNLSLAPKCFSYSSSMQY